MALNTNYGYPPSGYSSPYSSTPTGIRTQHPPPYSSTPTGIRTQRPPYSSSPTGIRTQRPRFGYSDPSVYPRSRLSASNMNTMSYSDSMINNYGTSTSRIDTTFNSDKRSLYNDSFNSSGSTYFSANSSFSHGQSFGDKSMMHNNFSLLRENGGFMKDTSIRYENTNIMQGSGNFPSMRNILRNDTSNSALSPKPALQFNYNSAIGMNTGEFKGNFQKNSTVENKNNKPFFARSQRNPPKMAEKKKAAVTWKCQLCSLVFTSQIPHDMHLRGSKHAKKLKANQALIAVKSQANNPTIISQEDKKSFFCELCNVKANSSFQLQTHLEGSKHKSKLQPNEATTESQMPEAATDSENVAPVKANGSLVRTLPPDFEEPQPSKFMKFFCETCNIAVNSAVQLEQHLTSKKHQNKVEGKPVIKRKRVYKKDIETKTESNAVEEVVSVEQESSETATKVVGVKTLASSFVQGETLQ